MNLGKKITDFGTEIENKDNVVNYEEQIDDAYGINVQFEESEEESDNDIYGEIRDEEGQDEGEEACIDHTLHAEKVIFTLKVIVCIIRTIITVIYLNYVVNHGRHTGYEEGETTTSIRY